MAEVPKKDNNRERVSWNIAIQHAQLIASLFRKAINHMVNNQLTEWRMTLQAIRESVNYGLSAAERKELDNMEIIIAKIKIKYDPRDVFKESLDRRTNEQVYFNTRIYQRRLFDLLNELGFFPSKEDRTKLGF